MQYLLSAQLAMLKSLRHKSYSRGGHSYSTRRTVRDRGQDAVKRSSRIFSTGQAVKRTFWVGQRSRPTFAQTNSYSNSHDFVYTVYLSRLTSAHALVQTGLTFHPFWNRTPSFIFERALQQNVRTRKQS